MTDFMLNLIATAVVLTIAWGVIHFGKLLPQKVWLNLLGGFLMLAGLGSAGLGWGMWTDRHMTADSFEAGLGKWASSSEKEERRDLYRVYLDKVHEEREEYFLRWPWPPVLVCVGVGTTILGIVVLCTE